MFKIVHNLIDIPDIDAEKDVKSNGQPGPPAVDRIKIFDNDDQAAKQYCCLPSAKL